MGGNWYDLDNLVQDAEDLYHDAEHVAGKAIDGIAHGTGAALDAVGLRGAGDAVRHWGDEVADQLGATPDEKSLGQTHDPRELVHGDPGAMRDRAGKLDGFSGDFNSAGEGLRAISTGDFSGRMADAYHHAVETEYPKWLKASHASKDGSSALTNLAEAVEWAQGRAADAIRVWDEAERKHNEWQQKHDDYANGASDTDPGEDPGPALREQANDLLKGAREHRNSAAAAAASSLNNAAGEAPPMPSASQRLLDDAVDAWNTAGMFDSHMVVGVAETATGLVKLVRTVDPTNPYNLAHPAQYAANAAAVGAGLVKMAAHPDELIKGFIGTGWKDDPGQATGALLANLAPFGPKGAGIAKSVLSDALKSGMRGAARDGLEGGVRDVATHTHLPEPTRLPETPRAVETPHAMPSEHAPAPEAGPAAGVHDAPAPAEHAPPVEHAPPAEPAPVEHAPAGEQTPPAEHAPPAEPVSAPADHAPPEHDPQLGYQPSGPATGGEHGPPLDRGSVPESPSEPVRPSDAGQPASVTEPAGPQGGDGSDPGPSGPPSETVKPVDAHPDPHQTPVESASSQPHVPENADGGHGRADGHVLDSERTLGRADPAATSPSHPGRGEPAADGVRPVERGPGEHGRPSEVDQPKPTGREPAARDGSPARESAPRDAVSEKPTARPSGDSRVPTTAARASEAAARDEAGAAAKAGPHEPVGHGEPQQRTDLGEQSSPGASVEDGGRASPPEDRPGQTPENIPPEDIAPPFVRDTPFQTGAPLTKYFREQYPDGPWGAPGVEYLDDVGRETYRITIRDGLVYDSRGMPFDTRTGVSALGNDGRAIFVMDEHGNLYASLYQARGLFHHSSFFGGRDVASAGELVVKNGKIEMLTDHSGHYMPGRSRTQQVLDQLANQGIVIDPKDIDYWAPPGT